MPATQPLSRPLAWRRHFVKRLPISKREKERSVPASRRTDEITGAHINRATGSPEKGCFLIRSSEKIALCAKKKPSDSARLACGLSLMDSCVYLLVDSLVELGTFRSGRRRKLRFISDRHQIRASLSFEHFFSLPAGESVSLASKRRFVGNLHITGDEVY